MFHLIVKICSFFVEMYHLMPELQHTCMFFYSLITRAVQAAGWIKTSTLSLREGLRIAAVLHLKNAGQPAGLGPWVRGRKWCHAVRCCPALFLWQPHCTEGLPTGWEWMGPVRHCSFPQAHWAVHGIGAYCLWASPGVPSGIDRSYVQ